MCYGETVVSARPAYNLYVTITKLSYMVITATLAESCSFYSILGREFNA